MSIVLGIKRPASNETNLALPTRQPPFSPCCVCSASLDHAHPIHVCNTCRKGHCERCGAWLDDGSRKCIICLAGAGCTALSAITPAPAQSAVPTAAGQTTTRPYGRGSWEAVQAITQDPAAVTAARAVFDGAVYATTSRASNESRARTWLRICHLLKLHPRALTPESIRQVMSVLRQAGYRSAKLILSQAKTDFIRDGGIWTSQLDQAVRESNRSADRDLGPPQQSCPYPVELITLLPGAPEPRVEGGPCHPRRCDVIYCFFALRGAEAIAARAVNVTVSSRGVSMTLSKTKTDPAALGTTRTHICACPASRGEKAIVKAEMCPACATRDQAKWALETFGHSPETPLFPNMKGEQLTKNNLVKHIEAAFTTLGLPTKGHGGGKTVGEHSCRNGIAVYLASRGVPVWQIQGLLRHSATGQTVLRYIREAHVHASTNLAEEAEVGKDLDTIRRQLASLSSETRTIEANIKMTLQKAVEDSKATSRPAFLLEAEDLELGEGGAEQQLAILDDEIAKETTSELPVGPPTGVGQPTKESQNEPIYVVSTQPGGRGVTHVLSPEHPSRTVCGWRFSRTRWHFLTKNPLCDVDPIGDPSPTPGGCKPMCRLCLG